MNQRFLGVAFIIGSTICMSGTALADRVDELAKCNAAYSIMTSLEGYNAQLGEHFTREASFLFDLTGLYGQLDRGRSMTNGEKMELWTSHLRRLDDEASNGAALKPHFFGCGGMDPAAFGGGYPQSSAYPAYSPPPRSQVTYRQVGDSIY